LADGDEGALGIFLFVTVLRILLHTPFILKVFSHIGRSCRETRSVHLSSLDIGSLLSTKITPCWRLPVPMIRVLCSLSLLITAPFRPVLPARFIVAIFVDSKQIRKVHMSFSIMRMVCIALGKRLERCRKNLILNPSSTS
jgi:hypothetical protein